jgi:hypothetical protein
MSDDAKKEKDEPKKDAAAAPPSGGVKAMAGPIAAGLLLVGIGVFIGNFAASFFTPPPPPEGEAGEGAATAEDAAAQAHEQHASLLHSSAEMDLGDLRSNVAGQGGKRYVVMKVVLRIATDIHTQVAGGGGGGGHGGGGADPAAEVKRMIQHSFEEHLKTYSLEELNGPTIYKRLERGFAEITERELKALMPDLPKVDRIVQKVVITGLLVQ